MGFYRPTLRAQIGLFVVVACVIRLMEGMLSSCWADNLTSICSLHVSTPEKPLACSQTNPLIALLALLAPLPRLLNSPTRQPGEDREE